MKKLLTLALFVAVSAFSADWTQTQADESIKRTLEPLELSAFLTEGSNAQTTVTAATPAKIEGGDALTPEQVNGFAYDVGNDYFYLSEPGIVDRRFSVVISLSAASSAGNVTTTIRVVKNGVVVPGAFIIRKIGVGGDVGAFPLTGVVTLSTGDYIEAWIECSGGSTITFTAWSTRFVEIN
jgi:hypothetical protein